MRTSPSARRRLAGLTAAALAATGLLALGTTQTQAAPSPKPTDAKVRVHWANGKALGHLKKTPPGQAVKSYLAAQLGDATGDSVKASAPAWKASGVKFLRMKQYAGGLRVIDSDIKAAFNANGKLISLIENTVKVSTPRAARASEADAVRVAVGALYKKTPRWYAAPSVEKVAVPMSDGRLSEGYLVTTWDADNNLNQSLVAGDGSLVRTESRTNSDSYDVFPDSPLDGGQVTVTNPADATASPAGWLTGRQWTNNITGNNAHAYLDHDNNNKPDANDTAVLNGIFGADFDDEIQPNAGDNTDVAVQNLFYLNNLIHDTLYRAGFTEEAGNFQEDNFGRGGRDGDSVNAEAQDGGGVDNANFATPEDGLNPRMQMYLWQVPGVNEVVQGGNVYQASGAAWGAQLDTTGLTGPLVVANDGTAPAPADACESIPDVAAGSVVIADRGNCDFTQKAANAQAAGAAGVIIANNNAGAIFTMGGANAAVTIPAVMVSQADGATIKAGAPAATTLRKADPPPIMKDGDLDSDIVWHEYGHGLTWRMIERMFGPMAGAIGEGMGDVLAVIANDDPLVGEYSASDPLGIRNFSYEGYPLTYGDIVGLEVHLDGEVYGAIGWDLWKNYKGQGLGQDDILADLVGGMNFTPSKPNFEEMRDGILMGLVASGNEDRACWVWDSFAQYGVGVGAASKVTGKRIAVNESFALPNACD